MVWRFQITSTAVVSFDFVAPNFGQCDFLRPRRGYSHRGSVGAFAEMPSRTRTASVAEWVWTLWPRMSLGTYAEVTRQRPRMSLGTFAEAVQQPQALSLAFGARVLR